jgi:hypothetical protein
MITPSACLALVCLLFSLCTASSAGATSDKPSNVVPLNVFAAHHAEFCDEIKTCKKYFLSYSVKENEKNWTTSTHLNFTYYVMPWFDATSINYGQYFPEILFHAQFRFHEELTEEMILSKSFLVGFEVKNTQISSVQYLDQDLYSFKYPKKGIKLLCSHDPKTGFEALFLTEPFESYNPEKSPQFPVIGDNVCRWNNDTKQVEAMFMFSDEWPIDLSFEKAASIGGIWQLAPKQLTFEKGLVKISGNSETNLPNVSTKKNAAVLTVVEALEQLPNLMSELFEAPDLSKQRKSNSSQGRSLTTENWNTFKWDDYAWSTHILLYQCWNNPETCLAAGSGIGLIAPSRSICFPCKYPLVASLVSSAQS